MPAQPASGHSSQAVEKTRILLGWNHSKRLDQLLEHCDGLEKNSCKREKGKGYAMENTTESLGGQIAAKKNSKSDI